MKRTLFILLLLLPLIMAAQNVEKSKSDPDTLTTTQKLSKIEVFPNPASAYFIIRNNPSDTLSMTIFNELGQPVATRTILKKQTIYPIAYFASGLYIIRFTLKNKSKSIKLIKIN